jgi:hypothetical protein
VWREEDHNLKVPKGGPSTYTHFHAPIRTGMGPLPETDRLGLLVSMAKLATG